jgi:hypothetical protein
MVQMIKTYLILIFLTIFNLHPSTIKAKETQDNWHDVVEAIIEIESNGNPNAVSKCGQCIGAMQIKKIVVDDCNEYLKMKKSNKRFTYEDRLSIQKSKEMFYLIQERYNKTKNVEEAVRIWNGGCKYQKEKTEKYFQKFLKIYKRERI